ncbi:MAG: protein translocase subunit SecD [Candidatus Omnitrophota bacterium]|nr:protein translocase subunit SecD [Candidatus Omnitrophota bacterium]
MIKNLKWKVILIVIVIAAVIWLAYPPAEKINLGLDLQGGMHLVLEVDTANLSEKAKTGAIDRALEVIRNRVDQFGVSEPSIQKQGVDQIIVQLPGITERERAIDLIGKTALLELKLVLDDPQKLKDALAGNVSEGYELKYMDSEPLLLQKQVSLSGDSLVDALVKFDQTGFNQPVVGFQLDRKGGRKFARLTEQNIGRRLAILLDGVVQSAPVIKEKIPHREGVISGRFTQDEASDLAIALRAGALPAPIKIVEERTIGPTLGKDSIEKGIKAVMYGGISILVFMAVYYLLAGLIANFALFLNLVIILGVLSYFDASLTLPGIAGIVLTIGMSVDANVLIFERIREELKLGKTVRFAITSGYKRAFLTILDANLTTLITALILFKFGTGPIRGFAVTLSIGILASMFTALFVSRVIFDIVTLNRKFTKLRMLRLVKTTNVDFIGKRRMAYLFSAAAIIAGLIGFAYRGENNFGIDFSGGVLQQFRFQQAVAADDIRNALKEIKLSGSQIQHFGNDKEVIIRTGEDGHGQISLKFKQVFRDNPFELLRVEKVGASIGSQLRIKALTALLLALLGSCIYITVRFEFKFAIAAIAAIFHDVLFTIGVFVLAGREISLPVIAALLTIVGYSLNDTIVVFDRIREDLKLMRKADHRTIINTSINQTLSRTLLTSLTTLLVVLALYLFGGEVINNFAFALMVGVLIGTYSSIFIASPLLLFLWSKKK